MLRRLAGVKTSAIPDLESHRTTSTNTHNLIWILALAASTSLPTSLTFNVTCAVAPMDYRLDGYDWRIKWYVFTDNVSYRHEHLTASKHLLCIQGMSFPNSPLRCRTYPRPSDVYLSPLSRLPLPFTSPAHRRPSTTQIYLARSSDSFSVITSELYVVSLCHGSTGSPSALFGGSKRGRDSSRGGRDSS